MLQPTTKMASKPQATLMKKHSQTDLVSRLKTRKVLGVGGEDDDGEVHRSKSPPSWSFSQTVNLIYLFLSLKNQISQMLGNESKFSGREPVGLRFWILISAVTLTVVALMAVAFPSQLYETLFKEKVFAARISIRLYGGALLSISLIMWKGLHTAEKVIIQWSLLAEACYLAIQFLVTFVTLIEVSLVSQGPMILLLLSQVLFLIVTLYFYFHLRRRPKKT